ncbi:MAG: hypothetical protein ACN6QT_13320 [Burkholderia contaminans]|jgi:hypothetical protein|uniref:Uncharacterized protein n=1 Tax=Burkholderia contaminans TaxID=488447 RepID=A0AAP4RC44_9BURK|nr:hypothetical protein [Burkholderia contaminans]MBD1413677.1 hypothetical protein [Burkholderia contaminans]MBH9669254.1 hypothetical protein [Burkholderia contaminans]MBH9676238.1 hypothetical protein [Burkholderia contaminans]MBH9706662.1 hypothetical protein [Burkholderia contaminans]MDN7570681.1 hypothetical protein [Burkholderia contaminans]
MGATVYFRQKISPRELAVRTGMFKRTVRAWQWQTDPRSRKHPKRAGTRVLDAWPHMLSGRFKTESHRPTREQCATRIAFDTSRARGKADVFDLPEEAYWLES